MDDDNESTHSVQAAPTKSRAGKGTWVEKNNNIKVKPWKRSMRKVEFVSTIGYVHLTDSELKQWDEERRKREQENNNIVPHFLAVTLKPASVINSQQQNTTTNNTTSSTEEAEQTTTDEENSKTKSPTTEEQQDEGTNDDENNNNDETTETPMNNDETIMGTGTEEPQSEADSNPFGGDDDDMDFMRDD